MSTAAQRLRVGRIPYVNCYPVYGAVDRGIVPLDATLVDGVPTALNGMMADGTLDVSVVSAVEYARATGSATCCCPTSPSVATVRSAACCCSATGLRRSSADSGLR